jgi:polysaccharide biosynthesis transport protein
MDLRTQALEYVPPGSDRGATTHPLWLRQTMPMAPAGAFTVPLMEAAPPPPELPSFDLFGHLRRLLRWWWLIALCLGLGGAAAVAYLKVTPKIYSATATVRVGQEKANLVTVPGDTTGGKEDIKSMEMMKTLEQGFVSQNNLLKVIDAQGLRSDPTFVKPKPDGSPYTDSELIYSLGRKVKAELRRGTRLIDISVEDTQPARARGLAEAIVEQFLLASDVESSTQAQEQAGELRAQATRLEGEMKTAADAVRAFRDRHPDLPLEKEGGALGEKLRDLVLKENQARADLAKRESALAQFRA